MSRTMVIARIDVAGSVTWIENVSCLLPLLGALRLLRGLLRRSLLTFRHCALQVRDGAIENVPSRIDMHGIPITPECKKQRLHLTKRVPAGVADRVRRDEARRMTFECIARNTTRRVIAQANPRRVTCIDKIRLTDTSRTIRFMHFASTSRSTRAQFRDLRCQDGSQVSDQKKILRRSQNRARRR
jgi:hypothetical protein